MNLKSLSYLSDPCMSGYWNFSRGLLIRIILSNLSKIKLVIFLHIPDNFWWCSRRSERPVSMVLNPLTTNLTPPCPHLPAFAGDSSILDIETHRPVCSLGLKDLASNRAASWQSLAGNAVPGSLQAEALSQAHPLPEQPASSGYSTQRYKVRALSLQLRTALNAQLGYS